MQSWIVFKDNPTPEYPDDRVIAGVSRSGCTDQPIFTALHLKRERNMVILSEISENLQKGKARIRSALTCTLSMLPALRMLPTNSTNSFNALMCHRLGSCHRYGRCQPHCTQRSFGDGQYQSHCPVAQRQNRFWKNIDAFFLVTEDSYKERTGI